VTHLKRGVVSATITPLLDVVIQDLGLLTFEISHFCFSLTC